MSTTANNLSDRFRSLREKTPQSDFLINLDNDGPLSSREVSRELQEESLTRILSRSNHVRGSEKDAGTKEQDRKWLNEALEERNA